MACVAYRALVVGCSWVAVTIIFSFQAIQQRVVQKLAPGIVVEVAGVPCSVAVLATTFLAMLTYMPAVIIYIYTEVKSRGLKQKEAGMPGVEPLLRPDEQGNWPDALSLAFKVAAALPWPTLACRWRLWVVAIRILCCIVFIIPLMCSWFVGLVLHRMLESPHVHFNLDGIVGALQDEHIFMLPAEPSCLATLMMTVNVAAFIGTWGLSWAFTGAIGHSEPKCGEVRGVAHFRCPLPVAVVLGLRVEKIVWDSGAEAPRGGWLVFLLSYHFPAILSVPWCVAAALTVDARCQYLASCVEKMLLSVKSLESEEDSLAALRPVAKMVHDDSKLFSIFVSWQVAWGAISLFAGGQGVVLGAGKLFVTPLLPLVSTIILVQVVPIARFNTRIESLAKRTENTVVLVHMNLGQHRLFIRTFGKVLSLKYFYALMFSFVFLSVRAAYAAVFHDHHKTSHAVGFLAAAPPGNSSM